MAFIMIRCFVLLSLVTAGCASAVDESPAPEPADKGLVLRVEMKSPKILLAGQRPEFAIKLVNESRERTFRVVQPGDGSESGWREPYVHWTGTIDRGDGRPVPVPGWDGIRCKLFANEWDKDFVDLGPGDELPVEFEPEMDFQWAGKVRLQAHYEYSAGRGSLSKSRLEPHQLVNMRDIEPFSIASEPVEFEITRPVDLQVHVKKPMTIGRIHQVSDILDVRLVNRTNKAIAYDASYSSANLHLLVDRRCDSRPDCKTDSIDPDYPRSIPAGATVSLMSPNLYAGGFDGTWRVDTEETIRMCALCVTDFNGTRCELLSDWVEIPVRKSP